MCAVKWDLCNPKIAVILCGTVIIKTAMWTISAMSHQINDK